MKIMNQYNDIINLTSGAIEYFTEAWKDRFKKFTDGAMNPKYAPLTQEQLDEIEGLQSTYSAEHLGKPLNTIPIRLPDNIEISKHAKDRMEERRITHKDLQPFIDNSMFMFEQNKGRGRLYVSSGGSIVISIQNNPNGIVVTVYSVNDYYSDQLGPIVEEVKKWLKPAIATR